MVSRLVNCFKSWGIGVVFLSFPVLIIYPEVNLGDDNWKILLFACLLFLLILLLFEYIFRKYIYGLKQFRFLVLYLILIIHEIVFFYLALNLTQAANNEKWIAGVLLFLPTLIASFIILRILFPKRNLIIAQKEI